MGRFLVALIALIAVVAVPSAGGAHKAKQPRDRQAAHAARVRADREQAADARRLAARAQPRSRTTRKLEARVQRMLSQLTLEEKVGQMTQPEITSITPAEVRQYHIGSVLNGGGSWPGANKHAAQADWLALADAYWEASKAGNAAGVPAIWGIDAVHGNSNVFGATLFPHNIGLGAAHDPCLIRDVQAATARQVRATGQDWAFAPTLAVVRDDRWGRTYEGFSEDPRITRAYGYEAIRGLQGHSRARHRLRRRDRHRQALHRRRRHRGRQGPGRQPLLRGGDDQPPRPGLLRRAGRRLAERDGLVQLVDQRGARASTRASCTAAARRSPRSSRARWASTASSSPTGTASARSPGCTNASCPQAINAGIDVVMVPAKRLDGVHRQHDRAGAQRARSRWRASTTR